MLIKLQSITLIECTNIELIFIKREQQGPNCKFADPQKPRAKAKHAACKKDRQKKLFTLNLVKKFPISLYKTRI